MCYTAWVPDGEAAQYWTKQGGEEHSNKQDKVDLSQTLKIQHTIKSKAQKKRLENQLKSPMLLIQNQTCFLIRICVF